LTALIGKIELPLVPPGSDLNDAIDETVYCEHPKR
jgi:hypothetical protein